LARQIAVVLAAGLGLSVSAASAKSYVAVPAVDWDALVPYARASIVSESTGGDFHVFGCPDHTDQSVVTPFDDALADFTRVLITRGMRTGRRAAEAVAGATGGFRAQYREQFWQSLSRSQDPLPRLQSSFLKARKDGRLRCWLCDKEPGYAPAVKRIP